MPAARTRKLKPLKRRLAAKTRNNSLGKNLTDNGINPVIFESSTPLSSEEFIINKKVKTKKTKLVGIKPKTKKNK
jgi:hypothetical protein